MSKSWKILVPVAEINKPEVTLPSISEVKGKVVAFVSNERWLSLTPIWNKINEVLPATYGVSKVFKVTVPALQQAPPVVLDDVASRSDAAVVALAN